MDAEGEQTRVALPSTLRRRRRRRLRRLGRLFYGLAAVLVVAGVVVVSQRETPNKQKAAASFATTPTTIRIRPAVTVGTSPPPPPANLPDSAAQASGGNTAPAIAAPHAAIVGRAGNSPISGLSLADAEAAPGDIFGVLLLSAGGRITVPNSNLLQFYEANGSHYVPFSGTLDAIRVALGGVRYTPDAGSSNNTLVILATDYGHAGRYPVLGSGRTMFLEVR